MPVSKAGGPMAMSRTVLTLFFVSGLCLLSRAEDIPVNGTKVISDKTGVEWTCDCVADEVQPPEACAKDLDCSTITCPESTYLQCFVMYTLYNTMDGPSFPPQDTEPGSDPQFITLHGDSSGDWDCGCLGSLSGTFQGCPDDVDCSSIVCTQDTIVGCSLIWAWYHPTTVTQGTGLYLGKNGGYFGCECTNNTDTTWEQGCTNHEVDCDKVGCTGPEVPSCYQVMFALNGGDVPHPSWPTMEVGGQAPPTKVAPKPTPKSSTKPVPKAIAPTPVRNENPKPAAAKPAPKPAQTASPKPAAAKPAPTPVAKESPKPPKQQSPKPATAKPAPKPVPKAMPKPATAKPAPVTAAPKPGRKELPNPAPQAASPKPVTAKPAPQQSPKSPAKASPKPTQSTSPTPASKASPKPTAIAAPKPGLKPKL